MLMRLRGSLETPGVPRDAIGAPSTSTASICSPWALRLCFHHLRFASLCLFPPASFSRQLLRSNSRTLHRRPLLFALRALRMPDAGGFAGACRLSLYEEDRVPPRKSTPWFMSGGRQDLTDLHQLSGTEGIPRSQCSGKEFGYWQGRAQLLASLAARLCRLTLVDSRV